MIISHDFIPTKSCPSYEFLLVFGHVWVWDRKSAKRGRHRLGWSVGQVQVRSMQVRARFLKLMRVRGETGQKFWTCAGL